ncbi:MAG: metal ABC transporter ATP-binding protein [Clostridium sp.]|jgi:zinc transport system ATP-binding protein|uniref:metal ABC transporter ATP-binding protein n=1 Tax=Clostridium sp. TaxID=1506 RepID=UPI0025C3D4C1|nr:metal ABC transporter ATP-binding protein [Clostridium sp.]MCH3962939.1 metal ABC transporter ATP-binding protein [Clostridium sp.]MCI1715646.1 metal ABC transporter ATP-binding protein [Clostridium sp.]MCI1800150.1 metal ABC transporter ATP-binding protein [Clostridium sp.]MCI1814063.1 metal ABC transporter ATP-binding protein [Clostridium sp.]MCI1870961.1 metal ABC transporter ATP-binding protein [Clostridium sp.]
MITIQNLTFSYNGSSPYLIENLNLNINHGSYTSILGENGSAKTTLIKLMLGLLIPVSGKIKLDTDKVGYVPQRLESFNSQFPITVYEILKSHMKSLKIKNSACIDKCLNYVGMSQFKKNLIGNLSGGQMQKIFIARALMGTPELLIFDEPSTGIDFKSQIEIYSLIKHLNKKHHITVLAVEHNLKAAIENSTHICTMKNGECSIYTISEYRKLTLEDANA